MPEPDVAVLVLAGGEGRRIGGAKPLRCVGDKTLIERATTLARAYGDPVAVSVRSTMQVEGPLAHERLLDAEGLAGPIAGLAAGLTWASTRGVGFLLTLPCDAPFLPRDLAERLCDHMAKTGCSVATPRSHGRLHPACSLWRTNLQRQLVAYLETGQRSLHGFAELVSGEAVDWPEMAIDPFFNVNTPSDLASAQALERQPHFE